MGTIAFKVGDVVRRTGSRVPWRIESIGISTDYWMRGREVYRLVSLNSGRHDEYPTSHASDWLQRWIGDLPASPPGPTRLAGHSLISEGAAFNDHRQRIRRDWDRTGDGRALCSCNELSDVLPSAGARKAWHKAHKTAIRSTLDAS